MERRRRRRTVARGRPGLEPERARLGAPGLAFGGFVILWQARYGTRARVRSGDFRNRTWPAASGRLSLLEMRRREFRARACC